jgi:hypothetical protein
LMVPDGDRLVERAAQGREPPPGPLRAVVGRSDGHGWRSMAAALEQQEGRRWEREGQASQDREGDTTNSAGRQEPGEDHSKAGWITAPAPYGDLPADHRMTERTSDSRAAADSFFSHRRQVCLPRRCWARNAPIREP